MDPSRWQGVARRRQDEINSAIPEAYHVPESLLEINNFIDLPERCGLLNERELKITSMIAIDLLRLIHDETYSAVEVTTAFCKRASIAHQATNCLAWIMFDQALKDAALLDEYMAMHHSPRGPLHGLPISVKECINVAKTPSTSGFIAWADNFQAADALIVKVLREAGAVFHVKTTNPQGLMALESASNLYGLTKNPHNSNLTPGGSTGGEGALIAMRGSLLGIGSDIGGSIRAPAAFSGIYGLKPSIARIPHGGLVAVQDGMENIIGVIGPMGVCLEDLNLLCKVVLDSSPWLYEPSLIELQWKTVASNLTSIMHQVKFKIGVMYDDGVIAPHPPVSRCMRETVQAIEKAGHSTIPWNPSLHNDLVTCINQLLSLDNQMEFSEALSAGKEPPTPLSKLILDKTDSTPLTIQDTWKLNMRRNELQTAYAEQWNIAGIDAILCPVAPTVASAHGESLYWGYTSVFNILDYSCVVFPVGRIVDTDTWVNFPPETRDPMSELDMTFRDFYTGPEKYKDAPVALQLVTRRLREEQALAVSSEILKCLK